MQAVRPRLYLHIGRNKAGSTTLQAFCLDHAEELKRAGVQYALFGYPTPLGSDVPTFPSHLDLADFVRAQQTRAVLVSHEGICCFPIEPTRRMASDLSELDVRIIFYVRPYRAWVVSSYSFDVRTGLNGRDFDRYLESIWERISVRPTLEVWGEALGWANIRVRSLHPADLQGGDLLTDFRAAIGFDGAAARPVDRLNTSASWMTMELLRTLIVGDEALGWDAASLDLAEGLSDHLDTALRGCGESAAEVNYLTGRQAQRLAGLYNDDLDFISARTGVRLHHDLADNPPERPFLPSAERVPKAAMRLVRQRALEPRNARIRPDIVEFVNRAAFRGYCGD